MPKILTIALIPLSRFTKLFNFTSFKRFVL